MKLLAVTNDFPPVVGGIENYVFSLLSRWKPDDLVVLTRNPPKAAEFDTSLSFETVRLPVKTLLPTPKVLRRARELIRSRQIDAVYFSSPLPMPLLGPHLRLPYSVSVHGGEFVLASSVPVLRTLLRYGAGRASVLLCESNFVRERVRGFFGESVVTAFVPGGVDPSRFQPSESGPPSPVILSVSRLIARKGPATLIRAMPRVLRSHPSARLVIVGGGPDQSMLKELGRREGIANSVIFAGPVPWKEISSYYASATIFALPTRERFGGLESEGIPLVFVEAAASGLPAIAGNAGGVRDVVIDGETGILVDGSDEAQVASAIIQLLDDPDRCKQMGITARERAIREFSWDHIFEQFRAALEAIAT